MKLLSKLLGYALLALYVFSLGFIVADWMGSLGFIVGVIFFVPVTLYQMISHLLVGDLFELILIVVWLSVAYGLIAFGKRGDEE